MSTNTRTHTKTTFQVETDQGHWCNGDTYQDAIEQFHKSVAKHHQLIEHMASSGVREEVVGQHRSEIPTRILGITRRTSTETYQVDEVWMVPPTDGTEAVA